MSLFGKKPLDRSRAFDGDKKKPKPEKGPEPFKLFTKLLPFQWASVSFPVTKMSISLGHDLAEHKYWGQDGARVEATGRQPLQFDAVIPFRNRVFPGKGEAWAPALLYPDGFRAFLAAMAERKTQELQHPELGTVRCKPKSCHVNWDGARQDGVDVEASWVETIDEETKGDAIAAGSPVSAQSAAGDLDTILSQKDALLQQVPDLPEYEPSFGDTVASIAAVGDQVSILSKRVAGRIDNLAYQVDRISDSTAAARNALTWPVDRACMRLGESLARLKTELVAAGTTVIWYTPQGTVTLAALAITLGQPVDALLKLNPALARDGTVRAGRVVKYTKSKF